jgi:hypothetical protein
MPAIAPARFRVALVDALEALGKAPDSLTLYRHEFPGEVIIDFGWMWSTLAPQSMQLTEADVIERGPDGIATLIAMPPKRRRAALKLAEVSA